jgi:hypothetical protein
MPRSPSASQFAGAAGAEVGEGLLGQPVELPCSSIPLDFAVETDSLEMAFSISSIVLMKRL